MARGLVIAGIAGLSLAACRIDPAPPAGFTPAPDACGAAALQGLVGQPASVLERMRFDGPVRIIRPGMAVTLDYRPDRLNIAIDDRERIARVHCV